MASVAVVVLDTLRYDTFRTAFDWLDGLRFSNAYSTSHWTVLRLVEYHGLVPFHDAQFDRRGIADLKDPYDRPRDGFVAPGGFYGFETPTDGFQSVNESSSGKSSVGDAEEQLRELVEPIDRRDIEREEVSVLADVQDQLEDLGYA